MGDCHISGNTEPVQNMALQDNAQGLVELPPAAGGRSLPLHCNEAFEARDFNRVDWTRGDGDKRDWRIW